MGQKMVPGRISPTQIYGSFWLFANVVILFVCYSTLFIPRYLKQTQRAAVVAAENNGAEVKTISLERILVCSCGLAIAVIIGQGWEFALQFVERTARFLLAKV